MKIRIKTTLLLLFALSVLPVRNFNPRAESIPDIGRFDISEVRRSAGAPEKKSTAAAPDKSLNIPAVALRMVLSLVLILALLLGAAYLFRKFFWKGRNFGSRGGLIDVIETTSVMPGKNLSLVRASDRVLLLGITQDHIQCLTQFEGEQALEIIQAGDRRTVALGQFSASLNSFMERFKFKSA